MINLSRQDTKLKLGELAPQMRDAEAAYMADDATPLNALLAELPGNETLQMWSNQLQCKRADARFKAWLNSGNELTGCA